MSSFEEFWDEFQARFSRAPVWLPGTSMQLGDFGTIDKRGYLAEGNLSDFGISFEERQSAAQPEYFVSSQYASSKEIEATGKASDPAAAAGQVEAGMHMSFSAAKAFVVRAGHVRGVRIADVLKVEEEIKRRNRVSAFWDKRWIYVQEVISAQPCIVAVSESSGAEATVKASASGPGIARFADLFSAGASLRLSAQGSNVQQVVTNERVPLMWRGRWLRRRRWTSRGGEDGSKPEIDVSGMRYEDFDDPSEFQRDINGRL